MSKKIIIPAIIILALLVGGIVWLGRKSNKSDTATPVLSVTAFNQTKNLSAQLAPANPNDIIVFALTAENQTTQIMPGYVLEANLSEIGDKATLIDASGASYNSGTNSLVWTPLDIASNGSIQKQFQVRVNAIPAGSSNVTMKINFNNELVIAVEPSAVSPVASSTTSEQKPIAQTPVNTYKAPTTGPNGNLVFFLAIFSTLGAFILRKNYLKSQI